MLISRMIVLMFSTLLGTACGPMYQEVQGTGYPLTVAPYVSSFLSEAGARGRPIKFEYLKGLSISLGDAKKACKSETAIGCCETFAGSNERIITVSEFFWSVNTDADRTEVLFHELGHCLLDYKHRDHKDEHKNPKSVMNSSAFSGKYFSDHYGEFMVELFSQ